MSKLNGIDFSSITALSGKSLVDSGGSYDPVAGTGTFIETVPTSGLLRVGGLRTDTKPGYNYDPNPAILFSTDEDGLYMTAQFDTDSSWTKIAMFGSSPSQDNATYAINGDGELWGKGRSSSYVASTSSWSQITQSGIVDDGWTDITASGAVVLGINSGKLYLLGSRLYGGDGATNYHYNSFLQVGSDTDWVSVATGINHSVAIKGADRKVYSCGTNSSGRTGLNTTSGSTSTWTLMDATNLDGATNEDIDFIACGYETTLVIQNGKAFFCGQNRYTNNAGLTSGSKSVLTQIGKDNGTFKTDWSGGYVGNYSSHLIDTSGRLWWTGAGNYGASGSGTSNNASGNFSQIGSDTDWTFVHSTPTSFSSHVNFVAIKGGNGYFWGRNSYSNIIDSSTATLTSPTLINSGSCSALTPVYGSGPSFIIGSFSS